MPVKIKVDVAEVTVNPRAMRSKIDKNEKFWRFAATEWWRLYRDYVPMDTGMLTDSVSIRPNEIEHLQPYAQRLYEGKNMHFSRDQHPKASARWDQAAAPTQLPKLATTLQQYIDSGKLMIE